MVSTQVCVILCAVHNRRVHVWEVGGILCCPLWGAFSGVHGGSSGGTDSSRKLRGWVGMRSQPSTGWALAPPNSLHSLCTLGRGDNFALLCQVSEVPSFLSVLTSWTQGWSCNKATTFVTALDCVSGKSGEQRGCGIVSCLLARTHWF